MVELALPVTCSGGVFENNRITGDGSLLVCSAEFTWTGGEWSVPSGVCILTGNSPAPSISLVSITITIVAPESGARVLAATSAIILSSQTATVSSCAFTVKAPLSTPLVSYTGQGTITFTGCCFSEKPEESSVYLHVASGSVVFEDTCFDLAKDKSITTGAGVKVTEEEFMFGNCTCIPLPSSSDTSSGGGAEGQGEPPSNLGMIIGIVVALLIVIAVVVILLILFVFRKRKSSTTTEDVDGHPEETGASFTVTMDTTVSSELAADSNPSPLFGSPLSQDVFGDSMEEEKLSS